MKEQNFCEYGQGAHKRYYGCAYCCSIDMCYKVNRYSHYKQKYRWKQAIKARLLQGLTISSRRQGKEWTSSKLEG